MQSGYGGVSEYQQFMMDTGGFGMAAAAAAAGQQGAAGGGGQELGAPFRYQPLHHHQLQAQHQHQHHHAPPQMPPHFAHFGGGGGGGGGHHPAAAGGIPFTQQLLHHQAAAAGSHHHHLQLFQEQHHVHHKHHPPPPPPQQQQPVRWPPQQHQHHQHHHHHHHLGLDVEAAVPESPAAAAAAPPGVPPFLAAAMSFKLAVDGGGGSGATGGTDDALNDAAPGAGSGMMLHGDDEAATESRLRRWPGDEEASIKEPTWRPLDIDYMHGASNNSKKEKAATPESPAAAAPVEAANYFKKSDKRFSELEAIYKPGSGGGGGGAQTGSGSGLTGDDNAMLAPTPMASAADLHGVGNADPPHQLNTSETSAGEGDAAAVVQQPMPPQAAAAAADAARRKRKRRRQQEQLSASASFFERLVQRLMEHQEQLHRQFLDTMELRERERAARDDAWRRQEADKFSREAAARAHDRASAAARESAIISYLEKLSGETISLPHVPTPASTTDDTTHIGKELVPYDAGGVGEAAPLLHLSTSRWPKLEVEALIRVRTGLDERFQEPGLKGPLWEEVSARMAAAGYGRSAKRCKEKWENINKYFRKARESGKKRPSHAKTCPYFDVLDRLYSRSKPTIPPPAGTTSSELLDAVVVKATNHSDNGEHVCNEGHEEQEDGVGRSVMRGADDEQEEEEEEGESHGDH